MTTVLTMKNAVRELVPVVRERLADLETPVSAFAKLRPLGGAFLLESVEGGERMGRYSFIGVLPRATLVFRDGVASILDDGGVRAVDYTDPLNLLRSELGRYRRTGGSQLPRFSGGAVGYVRYQAARRFARLPAAPRDAPAPAPLALYRALRHVNPSPYMFLIDVAGAALVGASPEPFVRVENGRVVMYPIAGTRPRGRDEAEDAAMEAELRASEKERAEHVMLVDLARNDIGRVSRAGTVRVRELMRVDRFSHVMHLTSVVDGELAPGLDALDAFRACFPAGTVSGAPKIRAMERIPELETDRPWPYAGAVGDLRFDGRMDTCLGIRTAVIADGVCRIQAGAGIVADSDPAAEEPETPA